MAHLDGRNSRISFGSKRLVSPLFLLLRCLLFGHFLVIMDDSWGKETAACPPLGNRGHRTNRTRTTHLPNGESSTERGTRRNFVCLFDSTRSYFAGVHCSCPFAYMLPLPVATHRQQFENYTGSTFFIFSLLPSFYCREDIEGKHIKRQSIRIVSHLPYLGLFSSFSPFSFFLLRPYTTLF
jgi:hypothetical protein